MRKHAYAMLALDLTICIDCIVVMLAFLPIFKNLACLVCVAEYAVYKLERHFYVK